MSTFRITSCYPQDITILSNAFLDVHMPKANGEFVKIYLYLLRISQNPVRDISLTEIADRLTCTERDILRALRYWEKSGLLTVQMNDDRTIERITFADPAAVEEDAPPNQKAPKVSGKKTGNAAGAQPARQEDAADLTPTPDNKDESAASTKVSGKKEKSTAEKTGSAGDRKTSRTSYTLTADRRAELAAREDVRELLFIAEQYMARPLTKTDQETIFYFYDDLHFSAELIEYLIEYCVNLDHRSIRYIEKVGISWFDQGIRTVRDARESAGRFHKEYYDIFRALGVNSHNPIPAEIQIMDKWLSTYGLPMDVVTEACTRTVLQIAKPTIGYADKILTSWWNAGVRTYADIAAQDAKYEKDKDTKKPSRTAGRKSKTPGGSFYNFEQRNYDYQSLEAQLLNMDVVSADDKE